MERDLLMGDYAGQERMYCTVKLYVIVSAE